MRSLLRLGLGIAMAATCVAGATLVAPVASAAPAPVTAVHDYVAGPFTTSATCNSTRLTYVHDGSFSYVGSCYRQTNGRFYFNYH